MKKNERILSLLAFLLARHEPVSWSELADYFPEDYGAGEEKSAARKFERDKAELQALGVPLSYVSDDFEQPDGYLVDKKSYFLPKIDFIPAERALLAMIAELAAGEASFPLAGRLALAANKLQNFGNPGETGAEGFYRPFRCCLPTCVPCDKTIFEEAVAASTSRQSLQIEYRPLLRDELTQRLIDPYGLIYRKGYWVIIGFCHLRGCVRRFRLDRILSCSKKGEAGAFEPVDGFAISDYADEQRWNWKSDAHESAHASVHASAHTSVLTLEIPADALWWVSRLFEREIIEREGRLLTVRVHNQDGLLRWAIEAGEGIRIVDPPQAVGQFRELLERARNYYAKEASA
jgi:proteasome accessory factor B